MTIVDGPTADGVLPRRGKIRLHLALNDGLKGVVLTLNNIPFMTNNPYNLVSLRQMNNSGIFNNNENKMLYNVKSQKNLAYAQK